MAAPAAADLGAAAQVLEQLVIEGLTDVPAHAARCAVLHVDLGDFVAAVEVVRHPELHGTPIVIGGRGDPLGRGVVAGASPEAHDVGVDAGTPLRTALRRCPDAVFLPLDPPAYAALAEKVQAVLRAFPGSWEMRGWDGAFLEPADGDLHVLAVGIQARLEEATGLACSVGIGENKLQAKVASTLAKPGAVVRLDRRNWGRMTKALPPDVLSGIGAKRRRKLEEVDIRSVGSLATADKALLVRVFGPAIGEWLRLLARGEDDTPLVPDPPPTKSHGRERTFERDVIDPIAVKLAIELLARQVALDVRAADREAARITVTIRFAPFVTHTHSVPLVRPSSDRQPLIVAALAALERFELDRPVRMVGVRAELASRRPAAADVVWQSRGRDRWPTGCGQERGDRS